MTYTLDVHLYRPGQRTNAPSVATSAAELDELLDYALRNEQPHPTQIVARERPKMGPLEQPDHLIKVMLSHAERVGAILYLSPDAWREDAEGRTVVWITQADEPAADAPVLFADPATRRAFPADAVLPVERVREALHEFMATGERPSCVRWQPSPEQVY